MKASFFIIFFFLIFFQASAFAVDLTTFKRIEEKQVEIMNRYGVDTKKLEEQIDAQDKNSEFLWEEKIPSTVKTCLHCPAHIKLTSAINKVLDEMKKNPSVAKNTEVPIQINHLKFLFYTVKTREEDGEIRCERFKDFTPDLKGTQFDGQMDLMAQDVFKFDAVTKFQILNPKKEEIVYYYRGTGEQKNIIVQAVLTKEGGAFRYYYYRPTEKEKNPYNLPGYSPSNDPTAKKKAKTIFPEFNMTKEDLRERKDKFKLSVEPQLETRMRVIPKNINLATGEVSQEVIESVRLNANSALTVNGNVTTLNLEDDNGKKYVVVDVRTNFAGESIKKVAIPYEINIGEVDDKNALKIKGELAQKSDQQSFTLSLGDAEIQHARVEAKRNTTSKLDAYSLARDFTVTKEDKLTLSLGKSEEKKRYTSFLHRKTIKDTLSLILDVRVHENKETSVTYQLSGKW